MTTTEAGTEAEKIDPEALLESLNGYEEIAIEKAFGFSLDNLEDNAMRGIRALVFVLRRRDGLDHKAAHRAAMELTIGQLMDMFDLEDLEDQAVTDPMGEDEAPAPARKTAPGAKRASASPLA